MKLFQLTFLALALSVASCSSSYKGVECQGTIRTLDGLSVGQTQALIIDRFNSFSVTTASTTTDSGLLYSSDRRKYIPSAVTREGYLAQRVSDNKFSLINAQHNQWITYICPD